MKFQIKFKTPDVVDHFLDNYRSDLHSEDEPESDEARENRNDLRWEMHQFLNKFIQNDECITIEFDSDAQTATVVETEGR